MEPRRLSFEFLAQTPSPALRFANARPHHHHHLICMTLPHPLISLQHCFMRHTRNRALALGFEVFGPPAPLSWFTFANAMPHHHQHLIRTTTTFPHHPSPPFCMTHPKQSPRGWVLGF